jgi:hypothetical protein
LSAKESIWRSHGYGYVFHTLDAETIVYDVTKKHCIKNTAITDDFSQSTFDDQTTTINENTRQLDFGGLFGLTLIKQPSLPFNCKSGGLKKRGDENYRFNAASTFDVLIHNFEEHFAFTQDRKINWPKERLLWQQKISPQTTQAELLVIIDDFLQRLRDGHAILLNQGFDRISHYSPRPWSFWPLLRKQLSVYPQYTSYWQLHRALTTQWQSNIINCMDNKFSLLDDFDNFILAKTPENIAYLKIKNFDDFSDNDIQATEKVMSSYLPILNQSAGLIIDLRFSMGGSDLVALKILSYLINKELIIGGKQYKTLDGFSPIQKINVIPSNQKNYSGKIVVLTSQKTPSAAEVFLLGLQARQQAIFIGERSYGAFSDALFKTLPNGWGITLSNERYMNIQGKSYEKVGFPVNKSFEFLNIENINNGVDLALKAAIDSLHKQV